MFDASSICSYNMTQTNCEILLPSLKSRSFNVSNVDYRHIRTCCLKLKLSLKFSLIHNWAVFVRIIRSDNEYVLRNVISRHFQRKINNKSQLNKIKQEKSVNTLNLTTKFECDTPNSFRKIDISFQRVNK